MIEAENVSKSYNGLVAIDNISFNIRQNELYGFIGPDGSGKTTIFRIISTLLLPDEGKVQVNGFDVVKDYKKIRKIIGYMPGHFSQYPDLSVQENIDFFATIFNTSFNEHYHLIKEIYEQLEPFKNRPAGKLSGGMKQKLALCCALIHKPEILILDEPTTGVDAVSRYEFWILLKKIRSSGITVIVSTPYMDEASLCDRVALIQKGNILKVDIPQNIIASFDDPLFAIVSDNNYRVKKLLFNSELCLNVYLFGKEIHFIPKHGINDELITTFLQNAGVLNFKLSKINPTIEDYFIKNMV